MSNRWMIFLMFFVFLVLLSCRPGMAEEYEGEKITHQVFRLSNQPASEVERLIQIYLSKDGMTISDDRTFTLIVKDYPSVLKAIEEFITEQDKPRPNVNVTVSFSSGASQSASGWGLSAAGVNNAWMVAVWAANSSRSSSVSGKMHLVTMSDTWGEIAMGESVPYPQWYFSYAVNNGYISVIPAYRTVSTGFAVKPVVKGDGYLVVTVAPQISYFTDRGRGTIRFDKASATLRIKNGETIVLASGGSEQSTIIKRIFGSMSMSQSQSVIMMLTPVVLKH